MIPNQYGVMADAALRLTITKPTPIKKAALPSKNGRFPLPHIVNYCAIITKFSAEQHARGVGV